MILDSIEKLLIFFKQRGNFHAVIYKNKSYNYNDLYNFSMKISSLFYKNNFNKVMFSINNSPLSIGIFLASWLNRIDTYPVNPRFIDNEIIKIAKSVEPQVLIIEKIMVLQRIVDFCKNKNIKLYIIDSHINFLNNINCTQHKKILKHNTKDGVTYHISSGTEGKYHFYGHSTSQILYYAFKRKIDYGIKKGDISLIYLSFNHAYAFSYQLLPNLALGNKMILTSVSFNAKNILNDIKRYKISAIALLPSMYDTLCKEAQKENIKYYSSLRHLSVAGDQASDQLFKLVKNTFYKPLLNGLGMTEVYGYAQNTIETKVYNKIKLFDDVKIKISGKNKIGEICIKSPMQPIDSKNEWLYTGDLGWVEKNYIFFLGRKKNIIIKNGSNISPIEIEHYLYKISHFKTVIIIGQNHSICGEMICACIILKKNKPPLSLNNINQYLSKYIAKYKYIDKLFYLKTIPMNFTGKVDRYKLKEYINKKTT